MAALQGYVSSKVEGACSMHCSQQEQLFFFFSSCFVDIEPPQALFSSQHVQLKVDTTMTLSALVGLVSTWSAYNLYREDRPSEPDPLIGFQKSFLQAAQLSSPDEMFRASYPLFLMLCSSHS